ncbi:hypothetical protein [Pararhodobacter aggregans]|uniref:Uncharacterized protein n=1 Tax=Pararhodobacter aggregans TaxID=404875 RepID=A0A2T7UWL5_9RHOB|nr:hypothetical protein [Pararhodobacter aggregans]PTX04617.1 hypothetical protein C8N33_10125 [Pararhodobacter aggregans]PVE48959.1 hypothetical protein DDE23_00695 [Pararhodobacter aggregans]
MDALQEIASRAALRFHNRVERTDDDRRDILGRAYAELAVAMPEAGTVELALACNSLAAAFALALNGLYASGVPGGANGPATLFPADA